MHEQTRAHLLEIISYKRVSLTFEIGIRILLYSKRLIRFEFYFILCYAKFHCQKESKLISCRFLHLLEIVEGLYFYFGLSVCVYVCVCVSVSVCPSVDEMQIEPLHRF